MNADALRIANAQLWKRHPELNGRALTLAPGDARYRKEWNDLYKQALANTPPVTEVTPEPAVAPTGGLVEICPLKQKKQVSDCATLAAQVEEGDIVLRSTAGADSDLIRAASNCNYSHAGIVSRNAAGEVVIVDAYPGRDGGAVKTEAVKDFFCHPHHHASGGLVSRPKDKAISRKASQWAMQQTTDPEYQFALTNPWDKDPKRLYCSDLVHQSFGNSGLDIVPVKMDLMAPENKSKTISALRAFVKKSHGLASKEYWAALLAPDDFFENMARKKFGGTEYITPCQVAVNDNTDVVAEWK